LPAKDILDIILDSGIADQKKRSFSVVIPTYNHFDVFKKCIDSVLRETNFEDKDVEVVIVMNGCTDETLGYCKNLDQNIVKILEFPQALGYTKSINIGCKAANNEYLILLNNDTEIVGKINGKDWIDCLYEPFANQSNVGATGAKTLNQFWIEFLVGFVLMIKKELFEKFNYFSEEFSPGFGEEIDLAWRFKQKGYKEVCVPCPISHVGEATVHAPEFREEWEKIVQRNSKILIERYKNQESKGNYNEKI
jgi:GT2 family glycosyltransferase